MLKFISKFSVFSIVLAVITNHSFAQRPSSLDNFSNAPVVTIGGFVNTVAAIRSQNDEFEQDRLPDAVISGGSVDYGTDPGTHNRMNNNLDFANDSEIHVKVAGINEFGMKYGAVVELEADVSSDGRREGINADKSYVFTESRMGRLEMGNNIAPNQKMKVGPATFARAAGGVNGRYLEYLNPSMLADSSQDGVTGVGSCEGYRVSADGTVTETGASCAFVKLPKFILVPQSPVAHGGYAKGFYNRVADNDYSGSVATTALGFNKNRSSIRDGSFGELEDAGKINYYTPRISGWQLGLSFTPDTGNSGSSAAISGDDSGDIKNVISWGLNYSNNFGNLGFALSGTGERGNYEQLPTSVSTDQRNDLSAYDLGVMVTYFGFTLGGSYGSWGDSLQPKTGIYSCDYDSSVAIDSQNCDAANYTNGVKKFDDSTYWTAGVAYQFGPVAASVTHIQSDFQNNGYEATSLGLDYRMAKGFMPYLEVTQFEFDSNHAKATGNGDQVSLDSSQRQIKDNKGYIALTGILFAF